MQESWGKKLAIGVIALAVGYQIGKCDLAENTTEQQNLKTSDRKMGMVENSSETSRKENDAPPSSRQSVTQLIRRAAQQRGSHIATEDAQTGNAKTYDQVLDRVGRFAAGLKNDCKLNRGARVAILSLNSSVYLEYFFGVPWANGIVVPINIRLAPPEMLEIFEDCEVEIVIVDDAFKSVASSLEDKMPQSFKKFVYCGLEDTPKGWLSFEAIIRNNQPIEDSSPGGDSMYGLFYTGGTTGKAKGVMLSHGGIIINALGNVHSLAYQEQDKYLHCAPMFHLADAQMTFAITMACATHVFIPKFTPPDTLKAISEHKVTKSVLVPVMLQFCLKMPNLSSFDLTSLEAIIYGGSPIAPSLLEESMKAFPSARFWQGYGQTECSPSIAVLGPEHHTPGNPNLTSAGKPVPFAEVKIVDEHDQQVPDGTVGEILVRGPHTMIGYWKMPDVTAKTMKGGWLHTGDGGYLENGFIFIKSRIKDMIVSGGENVYATEVESCLHTFKVQADKEEVTPFVHVAVIGVPDQRMGELVTAVFQPKPGMEQHINLESVKAHCKGLIAGYKCPRKIVLKAVIPISGAGKIQKHQLRKEFWAGTELSQTFASDERATNYQ
mmetsp:Transcript_5321/g.8213  ORF Transcript_5321/g.8213 Transcript_5321/m.8213 type:complete len:606 (+) Transcript_5321:131-1948(+)